MQYMYTKISPENRAWANTPSAVNRCARNTHYIRNIIIFIITYTRVSLFQYLYNIHIGIMRDYGKILTDLREPVITIAATARKISRAQAQVNKTYTLCGRDLFSVGFTSSSRQNRPHVSSTPTLIRIILLYRYNGRHRRETSVRPPKIRKPSLRPPP